ncbi:ATP-binding protein [Phaeovulum sp. W22_SRMD_FR3]|uniref:ATP-binding protein n=1 Tax=Phaeovulum sp. W22_SRMD_FR3 TaxID=3240274 RepID=UPI003F9B55B6
MSRSTFRMVAEIDAVDPLALALKAELADALSPDTLIRLEIALVEALTNIVVHGSAGNSGLLIDVLVAVDAAAVFIEIIDNGLPAPQGIYEQKPFLDEIDAMAESGRGVALILSCADAVRYRSDAGGNHLELRFLREGAP